MRIWIDAQISPAMAAWIPSVFSVDAKAVRDLGLRDATDEEIFAAAKRENVIVMTKALELLATGESLVEITAPQSQ